MERIVNPQKTSCQSDNDNFPVLNRIPVNIAKAAWELWMSLEKLNALLWETFCDDFLIIDEQMERTLPEISEDDF